MAKIIEKKDKEAFVDDVRFYSIAIDRYPNNPDLFADRAEADIKHANRFDFDEDIKLSSLTEAVADANRAIQLDPSMAKAYLCKGTALLKLEEFQTAKSALEVGASLAPGDTRFSQLIKECVQGIAAKLKKEEREENLDGHADEDERRAKSKSFVEPSGTIFRGKVPQKLERMNEQSIQGSNASLYSVEMLMRELAFEKTKRYSFDELATFTSNFDNEIGSGAFGNVYKGQFSDGTEVAVKVLKMHDFVHHSFLAEIRTMGKTDHQNLIKLIGFCLEENMLALVYEYMENGSLDMILYKKPLTLEWDKLYAIAVELANAIAYLHHDCGDQIIHHDIKASNVLLDSNHLPKLSDFGLANLKDMERTHLTLTKCRGTPGYAAPEIWTPFSPITCKCDVYSFGMILFEILGMERNNRPDIWFPRHVWNKFNSGTLDDLITECGISENDRKKATILSLVALWCAQHTPEARPPMSMVATVLEDEIRVKMPPNPFLTSDPPDTMSPA